MASRCSSKSGNLIPFINLFAVDTQMLRNNIVLQLDKFHNALSIQNDDCVFEPIYDENHRIWTVQCSGSCESQLVDKENTPQDLKEPNQTQGSDTKGRQQKLNKIEGIDENPGKDQLITENQENKLQNGKNLATIDSNCSSKLGKLIPFINLIAIENQMLRNNIVMQLDKYLIAIQNHDCVFKPIYDEDYRMWTVKCSGLHESQAKNIQHNLENDDESESEDEETIDKYRSGSFDIPVVTYNLIGKSRKLKKAFMTGKFPPNSPIDKIYTDLKQKLIVTNEKYKQDRVPAEFTFQTENDFSKWYNATDLFVLKAVSKGEYYTGDEITWRKKKSTKSLAESNYSYTWTVVANLKIVTKNITDIESWEDIIKTFKDKVQSPGGKFGVENDMNEINITLIILVFIYLCTHPDKVEYIVEEKKFKSVLYQHLAFHFNFKVNTCNKTFEYNYETTKLGNTTKIYFSVEFIATKIEGLPFLKLYAASKEYPWEYNSLFSYLELFEPLALKVEFDNNNKDIVIQE